MTPNRVWEASDRDRQQAYLSTGADGQIEWMRVLCSGFRPVAP
jgi:hypothetical protein